MLAPTIGIMGKALSLTYVDPEYRTGLAVTVTVDGVEYACTEHPTLQGVYLRSLILDEAGSYAATWNVQLGGETVATDTQSIYIYESADYLHDVIISVVDEDGLEMADITVIISQWVDGGRELITYAVTNADGQVTFQLEDGQYRFSLYKSGATFDTNNHELDIDGTQDEYLSEVTGSYIEVPNIGYIPPVSLVTLSAFLVDMGGDPVAFRNIAITCLTPIEHVEAAQFIALEGRTVIKTSATGEASIALVPGIEVEVSVENTSIVRRFTVPAEDFNLSDYLGENDYFDVQDTVYPDAERTS